MRCRVRWSAAAVLYCLNDRCDPVTRTTTETLLSAACDSGSRRTKQEHLSQLPQEMPWAPLARGFPKAENRLLEGGRRGCGHIQAFASLD